MAVSQNGYSANDRSAITKYTIGQTKSVNLRKGSTGALLAHMADWFDANIRDIDPGQLDEWGYAERDIRGSTEVSNHASGTAVDVDATKWPLGADPSKYLTAAEIARVREHLKLYEGCIRWGGDYTGRKDPMHFEINRDQATCDRVWNKINTQGDDDVDANQAAQLARADTNAFEARKYLGILEGKVLAEIGALRAQMNQIIGNDADGNGADRLGDLWEQSDRHHAEEMAAIQAQVSGLAEALKQATAGGGAPIDLAAVQAAAKAGAEEALSQGVDVDVTVGGKPAGS